MDLQPQNVAVVGDRVVGEIYIGNVLGMKTIWYKSGKFSIVLPENHIQEPDHIIMELKDTINYI
ncbi:MAG: HAD hydrolase-like protein [Candidatus Aenigmarchaeota archaeon]|nr:HAD hydrolase-like protein [Candidatus Aenigmarchaeota archaeon]